MVIKFSVVKHSPRLVYRASFTDVDKGSASLIGSRGYQWQLATVSVSHAGL